jgi:hypothetical protein
MASTWRAEEAPSKANHLDILANYAIVTRTTSADVASHRSADYTLEENLKKMKFERAENGYRAYLSAKFPKTARDGSG